MELGWIAEDKTLQIKQFVKKDAIELAKLTRKCLTHSV
jgi:hypothetical protein